MENETLEKAADIMWRIRNLEKARSRFLNMNKADLSPAFGDLFIGVNCYLREQCKELSTGSDERFNKAIEMVDIEISRLYREFNEL